MNKYYSTKRIDAKNCIYNIIFGERSNGKTYSLLEKIVRNYFDNGKQGAIIRRMDEDLKQKRGGVFFDALLSNNVIYKLSKGQWNSIEYKSYKWYFCFINEDNEKKVDIRPFCYAFSLTQMEHDKSTSYPDVNIIMFDEFISRNLYLKDEFILFTNVLSTIIRDRDDVKIYMLGNTVNKFCPYFKEMGLNRILSMEQGTIDVYKYGQSDLTVAVEYCSNNVSKKINNYFAFDNPRLSMITSGTWEIDLYPHCPHKFRPKDIVFTYFINWEQHLLQCEIVRFDDKYFTYIHNKTTTIKNNNDLVFGIENPSSIYQYHNMLLCQVEMFDKIKYFYRNDKVFYQDNETGEIVRNYLKFCR